MARIYASMVGSDEAIALSERMVELAIHRLANGLNPSDGTPMRPTELAQLRADEAKAASRPDKNRLVNCSWCGRFFQTDRERIYCSGDCKRRGYRRRQARARFGK